MKLLNQEVSEKIFLGQKIRQGDCNIDPTSTLEYNYYLTLPFKGNTIPLSFILNIHIQNN